MRFASVLVVLASILPVSALAQTSGLSVGNYQLQSSTPLGGSIVEETYTGLLFNSGPTLTSVAATVTSNDSSIVVVAGRNVLNFAPVPATSAVQSNNTFTVRVDRSQSVFFSQLRWTFTAVGVPPVANAGPNQTARYGQTVTLNGSGSTNPSGQGTLTYSWQFVTVPNGSAAVLSNANTVSPSFVANPAGTYVIQLTVSNGSASSSSTVTVSGTNTAPVANAGSSRVVALGSLVQLTGAASTDVDGNPLTYLWTLASKPVGSTAALSSATSLTPNFTADKSGDYVVQLVVNDGQDNSAPATITISTNNPQPPVANAGPGQNVALNSLVTVAGTGTDPQSLPLTYNYSMISKPAGSTASLTITPQNTATFVADKSGTYIVQLIVNNGLVDSAASTVTISTQNIAPVANAGTGMVRPTGTQIDLDGRASSDADGNPLTYSWSMISKPQGSAASLTGATTDRPSFVGDVSGDYVVQLIVNDGQLNSNPATVTVTVVPPNAMAMLPNPLNLTTVAPGTLTVNLATAAGLGGLTVTLTSSNPSVASVPGSIFFATGATQQSFTVTPGVAGSATILATGPGMAAASVPVQVVGPGITLTLDAPVIGLGNNTTGHVTLTVPAPAGGTTVTLSASPSANVVIPASVTVTAGTTSANFNVQGVAQGTSVISATAAGYAGGSYTVLVSSLGQIFLPANVSLTSGQSAAYPVTLSTPAAPAGVTVTLSSSNPAVATISPGTVTIAGGASTPATSPQVTGVSFGTANIIASAPGYQSLTQTVTVTGSLAWVQGLIAGGTGSSQTATLTLNAPAASAITINLSSDNTAVASVPATVTIPSGALTVSVPVTLGSAGSTVLRASALPTLAQTTISVTVANLGSIVLPANQTVGVGVSVPYPVAISQPAPAGGVTISLASSNTAKVTISPATVTISPGQVSPATQPQITGVSLGTASIQASGSGLNSASQSVAISASASFSPANITINGVQTQNLTLNLGAPAPSAVTIQLTSSSPTVASVPASVSVPAGGTSATVPVTSVGSGSANITAVASDFYNPATASVAVFVAVQGGISMPGSTNLNLAQTLTFPVSISPPAPAGGVTINFNSDNPAVTVTSSAFIAAGATTPTTLPTVTGANFGSATITATATGYSPATRNVQVGGALSFGVAPLTVSGTSTVSLVLSLPASAPSSFTVNLASSNTAIASVPATATFAAGSSTANVPVTGVAPGSATITASAAGLTAASATVNVTPTPDISIPAGFILGPGQDQQFPITMKTAAPAGGVYVSLASSDPSKVTITPPLVYVPEGSVHSIATPRVSGVDFGSATITANANGLLGDAQTVKVAIQMSFVQPNVTVSGVGAKQTLALSLSAPAPTGGVTVNLTSSNPGVATVPASIFIPGSVSVVSVQATGVTPGVTTINASGLVVGSATATVTVLAPGSMALASNVTVPVGQYAALPITLGAPALTDVTVTLTSANDRKLFVTASVVIPAGATQPVTQPVVGATNIGTVTITATAPGYGTVSADVQATTTVAFSPTSISMAPSEQRIVQLGLAIPAPPGHTIAGRCEIVDSDFCSTTINLRSDNPSIAQVQPSVTYYPDGSNPSTAQLVIMAGSPGTTVIHAGALPYVPEVTLTVTVLGPGAIALPSGVVLSPGQGAPFAVSLSSAAPAGGLNVLLASSDPTKVTISPASVFFPAGSTTPTAVPQLAGVDFGSATITATGTGFAAASQSVQVRGTLTLSPQTLSLTSGNGSLTLTLSTPAPSPVAVTLTSSNPSVVAVASSVTISTGTNGVVVGLSAGNSGTAQITASAGASITGATADVTVGTVTLGGIGLQAGVSTKPGQTVSLPLTLTSPAPSGGVTVTLASATGVATVTPSVFIPQGATSPATQPQVTGVQFGNASITATAPGFTAATQTVQVGAALSFASTTLSVVRTAAANLQVVLSVAAPAGGVTVNLGSSNVAIASVPSSVTIPAGATSVNVSVTGVALGNATISASSSAANVSGASATVTVTNPDIQIPANLTVSVGGQTQVPVTLSQAAGAGGLFVVLTSSDTNKATVSPSTVFIAQGATTPVTQPTATGTGAGIAVISVSATGLVGSSATIQVGAGMSFSPASLTISGTGTTQFLTLNLPSAAPVGGLTVNLTSSNTGVVTVPAFANVPAGASSFSIAITSVGSGSATVQATASGLPNASAVVTVTPGAAINLPVGMTVPMGPSLSYPITLGSPAPAGGVYVTLSTGDSVRAKITPTSVYVPGGATAPTIQPTITAFNVGPNSVTASAPGYGTATQGITGVATVQFSPNTATAQVGLTGRLYLVLGAAAPPGTTQAGRCEIVDSDYCSISVNLKSDNTGVAYVQPSFTYYPDGSNPPVGLILFQATGVGTTTIRAGAPPYIPETTITITVTN